jgi:hypothetical protein
MVETTKYKRRTRALVVVLVQKLLLLKFQEWFNRPVAMELAGRV